MHHLRDFGRLISIAGDGLNRQLAGKINDEICRFRSSDEKRKPPHTCKMEQDLNLIVLFDISFQSKIFSRSFYIALISEVIRAFEFKWDPLNLDNTKLKSRIRIFGISKPRRTVQTTKLFDTSDGFAAREEISDILYSIEMTIIDPRISNLKGMPPTSDELLAFLKDWLIEEKSAKLIYLHHSDSDGQYQRIRHPRSSNSRAEDIEKLPILVATTDSKLQVLAEEESLGMDKRLPLKNMSIFLVYPSRNDKNREEPHTVLFGILERYLGDCRRHHQVHLRSRGCCPRFRVALKMLRSL